MMTPFTAGGLRCQITARAYLRKLENEYGWETEAVRSGSRGPTTRGCKRKTAQKAY